jgi:acetate kinase
MVNGKILRLTLKKKWFDMILSGEKKEEYREIKRYWIHRLCNEIEYELNYGSWDAVFNKFDFIIFTNGYGKNAPTLLVEWVSTEVGKAKTEWSDNWQGDVFVISLGSIIATENIK